MARRRGCAAPALLVLLVLSASSVAFAFRQETSDVGAKLHWSSAQLRVATTSLPLEGPAARESVSRALAAWSAPPCTSLRLLAVSPSSAADIEILSVSPWRRKPGLAAFTAAEHDEQTGRMTRALVELNGDVLWSLHEDTPSKGGEGLDLETIVLHELGHAIGLAHTRHSDAVMRAGVKPGLRRTTLRADDVAAACAVYPALARAERVEGAAPTKSAGCGCGVAKSSGSPGGIAALVLLLCVLASLKARRRFTS